MIFDFGSLRVEIDVHKTRAFYDLAPIITDGCLCDGCRNYILAMDRFPLPVKEFFSKTGIDAKKAAGYWVGFTNRISLPEDYLSAPAIQMEIDFHAVPWMLGKENTY